MTVSGSNFVANAGEPYTSVFAECCGSPPGAPGDAGVTLNDCHFSSGQDESFIFVGGDITEEVGGPHMVLKLNR